MPSPELERDAFVRRYLLQFADPAFDRLRTQLDDAAQIAWEAYRDGRKSPNTRRAGADFADPDYDLSVDWIAARDAIEAAAQRHAAQDGPDRFLLINASPRSEHTCPGEMSKSWRLIEIAATALGTGRRAEVTVLDLSRLTSE
jgi:hypothetical protein